MSLPLDTRKAKAPKFIYASHRGVPVSHLPASFGRKVMPPIEAWHHTVAPWEGEVDSSWEPLIVIERITSEKKVQHVAPLKRAPSVAKPNPTLVPPWQGPTQFGPLPRTQVEPSEKEKEQRRAERREIERRQRLGIVRNANQ